MPDPKSGLGWAVERARAGKAFLGRLLSRGGPRGILLVAAALGAGVAALAAVGLWVWIYWGLPRVPDAAALWSLNRQPGITFLDRSGAVLGVRGAYHGRRVTLDDVPSYVPQAFLAIEDRRFYEHTGVDRMAVLRAIWANLIAGHTVQGGSTISQQLARNLFLTPAQTVNRKLREMVLASRIEGRLSKTEILELYLNRVYLGDQAYGIDAAARRFFGKPAGELTLAEAAMLAGLPKAPSRSAPTENLERATQRQHVVLAAMVDAGFITSAQRDEAVAQTIHVADRAATEASLGYAFDLAADEARRYVGEDSNDLLITLTIDRPMQQAAAAAVRARLGARAFGRHPLQGAYLALDRNGGVRALIGGTNYNASKFNRVVQARRQPGSSFKTFVYTAALEHGLDSEDVRYDEPVVIQGWRPRNYDDGYRGAVTLRTAFALSLNTVAATVTDEVGAASVADLARRLGVRTMPAAGAYVPPSIALGSVEVTLWDMTQAFAAYMLEGRQADAYLVQHVDNSSGETLYERPLVQTRQVLDPDLARRMTSMMGTVVLHGTGTHAQLDGRDVAGKTGTSQDWRDAWFIGYTADYVGGAWVGFDDRAPMSRVTGGSLPADIWADAMRAAHRNIEPHPLPGIDQPAITAHQVEMSGFFRSLARAFGDSDLVDSMKPDDSAYYR